MLIRKHKQGKKNGNGNEGLTESESAPTMDKYDTARKSHYHGIQTAGYIQYLTEHQDVNRLSRCDQDVVHHQGIEFRDKTMVI